MIRRKRLQNLAPKDEKEWQKQYYTHQKYWQRKRLLALHAIWDGKNLADVCREHKIGRTALVSWLDKYLHGGYKKLLSRNEGHRPQLLSEQRQRIVRYMMLHKTPADYGIDSYQWTANFMQLVVKNKWQVEISAARLYQLFHQWGLSVQKVHRDYGPTDPQAQAEFVADIKKKRQSLVSMKP